jgi:hypothetical protein
MAAIGGKVCLDMGHLDRRAHEAKGKSTCCMDEFLRNVRAEETDRNTVFGERKGNFSISLRSDGLEFF